MPRDATQAGRLGQNHWRCRIAVDERELTLLRQLGADGRIDADHFAVRDGIARLLLRDSDIALLRAAGLDVEQGSNVRERLPAPPAERVRAPRRRAAPLEATSLQTGFVDQYLDTAGILARFAALHAEFPALTQWIDLPFPSAGYDGSVAALHGPATVKLFRIVTTPASLAKPGLLLIAGIHAREWMPPLAAIEFAEQLLRTYTPGSAVPEVAAINALVERLDILIIPAANPDGIAFSHHDDAMWRKNRRDNPPPAGPACNGVDNNRNYDMHFGDAGSSGDPCSLSFRGAAAFSEPENRNVLHVIEQFPNILTAIDCHSFGEDLFRAQPSGGLFIASQPVEPRDHTIFLGLEAAMNAAIASVSPGKTYSTGTTNNHAGTCDDYLFLAHRIFGFTLECGLDFQPLPFSIAVTVVQEVSAALRALARETLTLAAQFTFPVAIAQAIDRSGSMVASGYVDATRQDAKRLTDLMSLNDSLAIVSFNQAATTHAPLAAIGNPSDYASARAAIDGIAFGGLTSIGAGLQAAAATLAGASGARAVVLLSDGYQNRAPWVADVLAALPAGLEVHTIALGPASDQALLESIADATGGHYAFAPDTLELHEIYNFVRAEAVDEALALNESASLPAGEAEQGWPVVVDEGAAFATFSVTWDDANVELRATLTAPSGPVMDLSRVRRSDGSGYRLLRVRRPQRGVWRLVVQRKPGGGPARCNVAAFLKSELRLRLRPLDRIAITGRPLRLQALVLDGMRPVAQTSISGSASTPAGNPASVLAGWHRPLPSIPPQWKRSGDRLPKPLLQALAIRARTIEEGGADPLRSVVSKLVQEPLDASVPAPIDALHWTGRPLAHETAVEAAGSALVHGPVAPAGSCNLKVRAEGRAPDTGSPFVRLALRSLVVREA